MARAGLPPRVLSHERFIEVHEQIEACTALLSSPDRPTAILAYSENEAHPLMCVARVLGLSLPRDLSIIVFSPTPPWIAGYQISVAAVPTQEMGRSAVRMLLEKLDSPERECAPQGMPYRLVPAQTTGPLPRS